MIVSKVAPSLTHEAKQSESHSQTHSQDDEDEEYDEEDW